jgi:hypothetical protein
VLLPGSRTSITSVNGLKQTHADALAHPKQRGMRCVGSGVFRASFGAALDRAMAMRGTRQGWTTELINSDLLTAELQRFAA